MTNTPRVLVIEDDPLLLQAIEKKLTVNGCAVIPCSTGQKGIAYLHSTEEKPGHHLARLLSDRHEQPGLHAPDQETS